MISLWRNIKLYCKRSDCLLSGARTQRSHSERPSTGVHSSPNLPKRPRGDANPRVDDGYRRLISRGSIANDARKR